MQTMKANGSDNSRLRQVGTWMGAVLAGLLPRPAYAEPEARVDSRAAVSEASASTRAAPSTSDLERGAVLLAGKVGGIASFNGLSPFVTFGVEAGYRFPGTGGTIAAVLAVDYTAPSAEGSEADAVVPQRVPGGAYTWELRQKELVIQPTFVYRLPGLVDRLTPYAGIGPRLYLLESVVRGKAGGVAFQDTPERSTKLGVGVPLGAELALGPGGLFAELSLQWAPLAHTTTGDTHLGGTSLFLGYRASL